MSDSLLKRQPRPFDRERFTIAICPNCGGRQLQTDKQRQHGGTYCYCKTNKGDPTRCEEIEAVAINALAAPTPPALDAEGHDDFTEGMEVEGMDREPGYFRGEKTEQGFRFVRIDSLPGLDAEDREWLEFLLRERENEEGHLAQEEVLLVRRLLRRLASHQPESQTSKSRCDCRPAWDGSGARHESDCAIFDAAPESQQCECPAGAPPEDWPGCPIHGHEGPTSQSQQGAGAGGKCRCSGKVQVEQQGDEIVLRLSRPSAVRLEQHLTNHFGEGRLVQEVRAAFEESQQEGRGERLVAAARYAENELSRLLDVVGDADHALLDQCLRDLRAALDLQGEEGR